MSRIWVDVEDVYWFFCRVPNPSGIQRLSIELIFALRDVARPAHEIRLCRCDHRTRTYKSFSFDDLLGLVVNPPSLAPPPEAAAAVAARPRRWPLGKAGSSGRRPAPPPDARAPEQPIQDRLVDEVSFQRGDVLLCLGSHWIVPEYSAKIRQLRRTKGIRFAFLCYDMIPVTCREWFPKEVQDEFEAWFDGLLPCTDLVMTISRYTADRVREYLHFEFAAVPPVHPLRIGHGFPTTAGARVKAGGGTVEEAVTSESGFVLFVSSIEIRKNHAFLLRVWRKLLSTRGPRAVPDLIFVGRRGWCVDDLYAQLENAAWLGGKVRILNAVADEQLIDLYRRCRLAIYPSLEEGWGLPIAEAVMCGAICLSSNKASMPEVVGDAIDYFDPDAFGAAYEGIERAIYDESYRARLSARLAGFRPRPWTVTAGDVLELLGQHGLIDAGEIADRPLRGRALG